MTGLKTIIKATFTIILVAAFITTHAQDQGFIYGKITTEDGDEYVGPIRWGKEEVYWSDMFNASKKDNDNLDYLTDRELDRLKDRYDRRDNDFISRFVSVSWDDDYDFVHEFSTAFGNIKSMRVRSSDRVEVELKNGTYLRLDGSGYNDVGAKIRILDDEIGMMQINWRDIEEIEFMPTPSLDETFGEPLYGTVESDLGEFTGYIQWDHDERVGTDKLDGDTYDGDVSIAFSKIKSIEREGYSRSVVVLKSGRELELRGSNDVNDDNRGIIVNVNGLGRVDIEWEDFDKVTFKEAPNSGRDYDSYKAPKKLTGTVTVDNGDQHTGEIIYDLDEEYDIEVLNGEDGKTKFIIPFKYIREITPEGRDESTVILKSGDKLMLEDTQDVGERHQGMLIKTRNDRVYVPWDRVEKVQFD